MTEAEFLDAYKYTRPEVTPEEFYEVMDKPVWAAYKRGVEGGKDLMLDVLYETEKAKLKRRF
jgi:hypothetical protein